MPLQYGVSFTGGFRLVGASGENPATVDFWNSATLTTLILPAGATLTAASGTQYPGTTAPPAPEPSTLVLLATGLALGVARRRRPARG